ncbi:prepilin-type N-terminal cleavage/methylation domain-containing protein [Candidatus Nomurabacteria bacterium]|nr:prepilin-type N-terminal cleavage/methylation domain-containing protein [Candidatus Nomurabacteria bacterium]
MKTLNSGFSLIEILITAAIGGILFAATFHLMGLFSTTLMVEEKGVANLATELVALKWISNDLFRAGVSFNTVNVNDDRGKPFFDFLSDSKCISSKTEDCERLISLTLEGDNPRPSIYFLLEDKKKYQSILYPPIKAYDIVNNTLFFNSLNKNGFLDQMAPGLWSDNQFLLLYSPIDQRPIPSSANIIPDFSSVVPAQRLVFFGRVLGKQMIGETFNNILRNTHPLDHNLVIDQADIFLRKLPSIGGPATIAFLELAQMIRYQLERTNSGGKSTYQLMRSVAKVFQNGSVGFDTGNIVATNIQTVVFKRENISSPVIKFSVVVAPTL